MAEQVGGSGTTIDSDLRLSWRAGVCCVVCVVCLRGLAVVNQLAEQSGGQVQTGKLIKFMLISQGGGARH